MKIGINHAVHEAFVHNADCQHIRATVRATTTVSQIMTFAYDIAYISTNWHTNLCRKGIMPEVDILNSFQYLALRVDIFLAR